MPVIIRKPDHDISSLLVTRGSGGSFKVNWTYDDSYGEPPDYFNVYVEGTGVIGKVYRYSTYSSYEFTTGSYPNGTTLTFKVYPATFSVIEYTYPTALSQTITNDNTPPTITDWKISATVYTAL